VVILREQKFGY